MEDISENSNSDDGSDGQFFMVEEILGIRFAKKIEFLIKWVNYPEKCNSWEPIDYCVDCDEAIELFQEKLKIFFRNHGQQNPHLRE